MSNLRRSARTAARANTSNPPAGSTNTRQGVARRPARVVQAEKREAELRGPVAESVERLYKAAEISEAQMASIWSPDYAAAPWGEEEEQEFEDTYGGAFERMRKDKGKSHISVTALACVEVLRCSPYAVVTPRYGMCYVANHDPSGGSVDSFLWSQSFCSRLSHIAVHPALNHNKDNVAATLMLAAAVLARDGKPRTLPFQGSCAILEKLKVRVARSHGCFHRAHESIRESYDCPGLESNLLFCVGQVALQQRSDQQPRSDGKLSITTKVLGIVEMALMMATKGGVEQGGIPMTHGVKSNWVMFSSNRGSVAIEHGELVAGLKLSWKTELRAAAQSGQSHNGTPALQESAPVRDPSEQSDVSDFESQEAGGVSDFQSQEAGGVRVDVYDDFGSEAGPSQVGPEPRASSEVEQNGAGGMDTGDGAFLPLEEGEIAEEVRAGPEIREQRAPSVPAPQPRSRRRISMFDHDFSSPAPPPAVSESATPAGYRGVGLLELEPEAPYFEGKGFGWPDGRF